MPFLQQLQAEAMRNADDPINEMMQRMWTSARQLRGREFCFILNRAVRGDEPPLADPTAGLSRGINKLCVSVPPRPPFPPGDVCLRGGGFDDRYRRCAPAFLPGHSPFVRAAAPVSALSFASLDLVDVGMAVVCGAASSSRIASSVSRPTWPRPSLRPWRVSSSPRAAAATASSGGCAPSLLLLLPSSTLSQARAIVKARS